MKKNIYPLEHNDPELIRQSKIQALKEGTTIKDKIIGWLKAWISQPPAPRS